MIGLIINYTVRARLISLWVRNEAWRSAAEGFVQHQEFFPHTDAEKTC